MNFVNSNDKFNKTRLYYLLFKDRGHDLFRHGLSEITPIPDSNNIYFSNSDAKNTRLDVFSQTIDYDPFSGSSSVAAKEDPVMFGFDIIIRTEQSPLFSNTLKESVKSFFESDFISTNTEIMSKVKVWEDFKVHFFQFFRDTLENETSNPDNITNSRFYYYLKKVGGLGSLVENNSPESNKPFVDYNKDKITLEFYEDVTLRVGKMAQLYKNLYWSRISGKNLIPENLLRFDCDIIISEIRNFAKVKKLMKKLNENENVTNNDLLILRDNLNRYVYTLYECQLFFDKMPHPDEISIGEEPSAYSAYSISFNYKYSTLRLDSFNFTLNKYIPINNATYDVYSVGRFDRFLNTDVSIEKDENNENTLGSIEIKEEYDVILDVVEYEDYNIVENEQNRTTNSSGYEENENGDYIDNMKNIQNNNYKSKSEIEKEMLENKMSGGLYEHEKKLYKDKNVDRPSKSEIEKEMLENKMSGGLYEHEKKIYENRSNNNIKDNKDNLLNKQLESLRSGLPKESWLESDSPSAKMVKRLAQTGMSLLNKTMASRFSLLNKTLDTLVGSAIVSNRIMPPENIYENDFNGDLYIASKQVKDALNRFLGESLSDFFKRK